MINYDANLGTRIGATNNSGSPVFNGRFLQFRANIEDNLRNRVGNRMYNGSVESEVLKFCMEHAKAYEKPLNGKDAVVLVHPFYLHLSHMQYLASDSVKRDAEVYADNLMKLLKSNLPRDRLNLVVLETAYHYAAATSLLLENGLVDRVVFTEYDSGSVLDGKDIDELKDKRVFFGGGYNYRCLSSGIDDIKDAGAKELWAIKDLCLNSPQDERKTLWPGKIKNIDACRLITLEDFFAKMNGAIDILRAIRIGMNAMTPKFIN